MINHAEIIARWNAQADEHNQWDELGEDEKIEWAFACGASATNAALLLAKEAMEEVICGEPVFGKSVRKALAAIDAALTTTAAPQATDIPSATASPAVILELMAERDKLREALGRIAETKATPWEKGWQHWADQARDVLEAIATADGLGRAAAPNAPLYDPREVAFSAKAAPMDYPAGAIVNGRTLIDRLENYNFECEAGTLLFCSDWHELKRCFEHLSATQPAAQGLDAETRRHAAIASQAAKEEGAA